MQQHKPDIHPSIDYSRKWYVLAAVAMGIFLATIDGSIVNVALPTLVEAFQVEFHLVEWVVLSYLLVVTTLMLSVGRLGDMIGKKKIYNSGMIIFTVGSVLCALAPSVYWLIGFRVLQAIGGVMMMALGTAILTEAFPARERGKVLGISGSVVALGIVAGPELGGNLIEALSWHWIFLVNLPVGIIGALIVHRFVPDLKPAGGQRFDYFGAITLFVSLTVFSLALTLGQQEGFDQPFILLLLAVWAIFLIMFLLVEWTSSEPMVDLRMFKNTLFSVNLITGFITFIGIAGTIILMPFYLENVLGYSTRSVGLLLAVVPIAMGLSAPVAGSLSDRFGTRLITVVGLAVLVVGYYGVSTLNAETTSLGYVLRFLPIGLGMGIFQSPNNSAIMGSVSRTRLGVASGLLSITRTLGQTVGIAALAALWASRVFAYAGQVLPQGATAASAANQVAGLHDTFLLVDLVVVAALGLSVWGLMRERRERRREPAAAPPVSRPTSDAMPGGD